MKISIAMATYNGAGYIREQLDSFAAQTRLPDELVICDDGSTDETLEIAREFAATARFEVHCHLNEVNLGYAGNFNAALTRTTGDLVFLSDQDDVWFPEKIEHVSDLAAKHPAALVVMNDARMTDGALRPFEVTKLGQIRTGGFGEADFVMGCCAAIDRKFLDWVLPVPSVGISHDAWIVGIANALDGRIIDERVLQYYRRHGGNESRGIFNHTAPVSKLGVLLGMVRNRVPKVRAGTDEVTRSGALADAEQVVVELERAQSRAPAAHQAALERYIESRRAWCRLARRRAELRSRRFPSRLAGALGAWVRGDYREFSGILSLMQDLHGSPSHARQPHE